MTFRFVFRLSDDHWLNTIKLDTAQHYVGQRQNIVMIYNDDSISDALDFSIRMDRTQAGDEYATIVHENHYVERDADMPYDANSVADILNKRKSNKKLVERGSGKYKADFLWPYKPKSIEEAGYEFINGLTEEYRKVWWNILVERIKDND